MIRGRISSTGIKIDDGPRRGSPLPCYGSRFEEIRYEDIVFIEERQKAHYLVKYLDRATRPFKLGHAVVQISSSKQGQDAQDSSRSSEGSSASALTGSPMGADDSVVDSVLERAYAGSTRPQDRQPILVIVNPNSGPGKAMAKYKERAAPIFAAAGLRTKVVSTTYSGEAVSIAKQASMEDHDTIVCVSGDGLPHEVLNGLAARESDARAALRHFALAQLPAGSGNAMCLSLNGGKNDWALVALGIVKGVAEPSDIMAITQGNKTFYSFLSQSYGIVADCDLGTEDLRWMGGARFTVGIVYKCLARNQYPCEIAYKEVDSAGSHSSSSVGTHDDTLTPRLTVNDPIPEDWTVETHKDLSMFYVGKMPWMSSDAQVFPHSDPLDGAVDMLVWDNSFGAIHALSALMKFEAGTHVNSVPFYKKIVAFRLTPLATDQYLSIDGESYPCAPFQVEVVRGAAKYVTPSFL